MGLVYSIFGICYLFISISFILQFILGLKQSFKGEKRVLFHSYLEKWYEKIFFLKLSSKVVVLRFVDEKNRSRDKKDTVKKFHSYLRDIFTEEENMILLVQIGCTKILDIQQIYSFSEIYTENKMSLLINGISVKASKSSSVELFTFENIVESIREKYPSAELKNKYQKKQTLSGTKRYLGVNNFFRSKFPFYHYFAIYDIERRNKIWDYSQQWTANSEQIRDVCFDPTDDFVYMFTNSKLMQFHIRQTGLEQVGEWRLDLDNRQVMFCSVDPDNKHVYAISQLYNLTTKSITERYLVQYDIERLPEFKTSALQDKDCLNSYSLIEKPLTFHPRGTIMTSGVSGQICQWDPLNLIPIWTNNINNLSEETIGQSNLFTHGESTYILDQSSRVHILSSEYQISSLNARAEKMFKIPHTDMYGFYSSSDSGISLFSDTSEHSLFSFQFSNSNLVWPQAETNELLALSNGHLDYFSYQPKCLSPYVWSREEQTCAIPCQQIQHAIVQINPFTCRCQNRWRFNRISCTCDFLYIRIADEYQQSEVCQQGMVWNETTNQCQKKENFLIIGIIGIVLIFLLLGLVGFVLKKYRTKKNVESREVPPLTDRPLDEKDEREDKRSVTYKYTGTESELSSDRKNSISDNIPQTS